MFPTVYVVVGLRKTITKRLPGNQAPAHDPPPHHHDPVTDPATDPSMGALLYQQHDYGTNLLQPSSCCSRDIRRRKECTAFQTIIGIICGSMAIALYCFVVHGIWEG
jgi:hypothetical protein